MAEMERKYAKERVYTRLLEADVFRHMHRWHMKTQNGRLLICKVRAIGTTAGCSWILYARCAPGELAEEEAGDGYSATLVSCKRMDTLVYTLW